MFESKTSPCHTCQANCIGTDVELQLKRLAFAKTVIKSLDLIDMEDGPTIVAEGTATAGLTVKLAFEKLLPPR
jgi:hypothetical protein